MSRPGERYQIRRALRDGGMSKLYLAFDHQLSRSVALKLVPTDSLRPEDLKVISREARILAQFRHPNIISVHDSGIDTFALPANRGTTVNRECLFIVQDLIEGMDFAGFIHRLDTEESMRQRWPRRRVLKDCILPALKGLCEANRRGVVHRDIKPGNLMIDREGRAYVIDFGLAQFDRERGELLCTPMYASPEQLRGEALDPRTDVYSFGATLYHVLTYEPPFNPDDTADPEAVARMVVYETPPPPHKIYEGDEPIPERLSRIVMKCMEKDRNRRYQSGEELATDLFAFLVDETPPGESWFWPSGETLIREGDTARELFYVQSGRVSVERAGRRVAEIGPGQWLGFAALTGETRTATVRAATDCETIVFSGLSDEKLFRTLEKDPAMAVGLTRHLSKLYLEACRKLGSSPAPAR